MYPACLLVSLPSMLAPQALVITRASTGYLKGGTCVLIDDDPHVDEVPQYGEYKKRDGWKEVEKIRTAKISKKK